MGYGLTGGEIRRYIVDYLGGDESPEQTARIDRVMDYGYGMFLDPERTEGVPAHKWTFLRGIGSITFAFEDGSTTVYDWIYNAPDDFGTLDGACTYTTSHIFHQDIHQTDEPTIRKYRAQDITTVYQYPTWFAIRWKHTDDAGSDTEGETKAQFIFYPTPQDALTVEFPYTKYKGKLVGDAQPLGGDVHSQTVLAACMAAAELLVEETKGHWWEEFGRRIRISIDADRRNNPVFYGYNGDPTEQEHYPREKRSITWTHQNLP